MAKRQGIIKVWTTSTVNNIARVLEEAHQLAWPYHLTCNMHGLAAEPTQLGKPKDSRETDVRDKHKYNGMFDHSMRDQ